MSLQRHVDYFSRKSTVTMAVWLRQCRNRRPGGKMTARERIAALPD